MKWAYLQKRSDELLIVFLFYILQIQPILCEWLQMTYIAILRKWQHCTSSEDIQFTLCNLEIYRTKEVYQTLFSAELRHKE